MSCDCVPCAPGIPLGTTTLITQSIYNYNIPSTNEKRYRIIRTFKVSGFGRWSEQSNELTQQQIIDAVNSIPGISWTQVS